MDDRIIKESILVNLNRPMSDRNFRVLNFNGVCDGTTLTRKYNPLDIQTYYVRLIKIYFKFYTDNSIWLREGAWDDQIFTPNGNSRYSTMQPFTNIPPEYLENMVSTNTVSILYDSQALNIFPLSYMPLLPEIDLNVLPSLKLADGIDVKLNASFYSDMEAGTLLNPYVNVVILAELLTRIDQQVIKND
jgi:hypothetical protein